MTPIRTVKNQYRGVNAHLHSLLQDNGEWTEFHGIHLAHLLTSLRTQLRPMGYIAKLEHSLQIKSLDAATQVHESDLSVLDPNPNRAKTPPYPVEAGVLEQVFPIRELIGDDDNLAPYRALSIRKKESDGEVVAWIELLSPTHKPGGRHFQEFSEKRMALLQTDIVFVEIDYLHESRTTFAAPRYLPRGKNTTPDADAKPYWIVVFEPIPNFETGQGRVSGFSVDVPIPNTTIPLSGSDQITIDFNSPYRRTFEEMFYGDQIDYAALPIHFERYSPDDQARILTRLIHIADKAAQGSNLETEPSPLEILPLDEAITRWQTLNPR